MGSSGRGKGAELFFEVICTLKMNYAGLPDIGHWNPVVCVLQKCGGMRVCDICGGSVRVTVLIALCK